MGSQNFPMHDPRNETDHTTSVRRSQGQIAVARGLWHIGPGQSELRTERLAPLRPGEVRIKTEFSGLSRGTERLVANGEIPQSEWLRMRAPMQAGNFPFPVKYGYAAAGIVVGGAESAIGKRVFALHPHQDIFQVPEAQVFELPNHVTTRRAVLAANMETALNAHWDAGTAPGDRLLVVGAGAVGLLIAYIARRIAGTDVTIVDVDPGKRQVASALGLKLVRPAEVHADNRIVFHASATAEGLETALNACAFEGTVVEVSWHGGKPVPVMLGGAFHSRRLKIISSQVGHVAPSHRGQVTNRDRLGRAISLLDDPALDALVETDVAFADLPARLPKIWYAASLPPIVRY